MSTSHSSQPTFDRIDGSERTVTTPEAGQLQSYWPWLLFKEAKQLAPLLIALAACGFVLHLLGTFGFQQGQTPIHGVALIMIPFLFAIGAGPMLVSQEKEQRTLGWIGSLPIHPRSIVCSKWVVCTLGLALSWIISVALAWFLAPMPMSEIDLFPWIGGTFALLCIGFALTWVLPTAVSSLIALAVVSCVMATLVNAILPKLWILVPFSLSVAAAAVYFGQRSFVCGGATASIFFRSGLSRRRVQHDRSSLWTLSPASSLIWQISRQNTWLWSGLLLVAILSGCLFLLYTFNKPTTADVFLATLLPLGLIFSWLGASVFGSDAYRQRINFLAQRGVAPGLIWWTRMILPIGSVCLGLVVLTLLNWWPAEDGLSTVDVRHLSIPVLMVGVLLVFAFTQWFSQWTRSALIGFCVAPAVAALTIGYQSFVIEFLRAPWWILLPSVAVAMLATRVMLRPWMDGRFDWRYWAAHSGLLLVALVGPLTPFLYTWATYPDMAATMKRSLKAEVDGYQRSPRPGIVDLISNRVGVATDDATAVPPKAIATLIGERLDAMEQELSSIDGPVAIPGNKIAVSSVELMSLRIDAMMDSENSSARDQADRLRYQRTMVLLDNLCRHLRLAERLQEQGYADVIERWLVGELNRPGRREIFTEQQYAHIVIRLADQDARHQARRRAVVMAWDESTTQHDHQFKNMVKTDERTLRAPQWLVTQRDAATAAASLLHHLESLIPRPLTYPGQLDRVGLGVVPELGLLWHRPWESKAKQLAESLRSTPATKVNDDK